MILDPSKLPSAFPDLDDLSYLAQSGQKYVFRGQKNGQDVALKIFKVGQEQERIDREIGAVASLSCDYVPEVLASGQRSIDGTKWSYLVEEFIAGRSLREVLTQEPLQPLPDVLSLGEALLRACCDFEDREMVHRDIKPANLIVDGNGKIWVIDFGIVRLLTLVSVTQTHRHFGLFTPGYGAPEQVRNLKSKIDARADLFSIGVVLYEALNGSNPYLDSKRNELEIIQHVCNRDLPRLTIQGDQHGQLADFLGALTARFPSRRPPTATEALDWFQDIVAKLGHKV